MKTVADRLILQNQVLRVVVLPGGGGRIESLQYQGFEFMLQPAPGPSSDTPHASKFERRFEDGACSGMDECLPTVSASSAATPGGRVPDHGDFWDIPWRLLDDPSSTTVVLEAEGSSRPLRFRKTLEIHGSRLRVEYALTNLSKHSVPFLYACHPLLAIDPGDRILLPEEVTSVRLESSRQGRLGKKGDSVPWPITNERVTPQDLRFLDLRLVDLRLVDLRLVDLRVVQHQRQETADMLYVGPLDSGWCGLYRVKSGRQIVLRFDPALLPFLGLWLCYGGWPDDRLHKQVAVALEPTVAPRGSLEDAIRDGIAPTLASEETRSWSIEFELLGPHELIRANA